MAGGLHKTWDVLAKTRNRAVLPLLARALHSSSAGKRAAAIRCLVRRHDRGSHRYLVRQFAKLDTPDQAVLCDTHRSMPHHLAATLKAAVLNGESDLCEAACQIIGLCPDFDLFPTLVAASENRAHGRAPAVLATIRRMTESLHRDLCRPAKAAEKPRRDPTFARRNVLAALEGSLAQYAKHQRRELIDGYLLLAPSDHAPMLRMLQDGRHPCHAVITDLFETSAAPAIVEKLADLLRNTDAPMPVLEVIARRTDRPFVEHLLASLKHPLLLRVIHNMKRLRAVSWLEERREMLLELDGRSQAIAAELAAASSISESSLFALLSLLMTSGLADGRRASCAALARFGSKAADDLVYRALDDPDAGVQSTAVPQLRQRGFPDALKILVALLDSRSTEVRDAARSSLAEFNFIRYRALFDLLDERAVKTTGILVHKVDDGVRDGLTQELKSPSLACRLRGIDMAVAMNAADDVKDQLIELARSDNIAVRQEAVAALGLCKGPSVMGALLLAAEDISQSVRDAAIVSLDNLAQRDQQQSAGANQTPAFMT